MAAQVVQVRSPYDYDPAPPAAPGPQGVALTPDSAGIARVLHLGETTGLVSDVARLVADYAVPKIDHFGKEEWMRYYGVDVGPEPELPDEFYEWWLSPDAIEPGKLNCETHLAPVLRPRWITETDAEGKKTLSCYSLRTLGRLVQHPQEGPPSQYMFDSQALEQHGNIKAGPARWLVMRKDVFARDQSCDQQKECIQKLNTAGADYDEMPSALDLATIVFATHVRTGGDRHLGDSTGKEGRWTFSRCKERIQFNENSYPLVVGGFAPGGLLVLRCYGDYVSEYYGVAALRKF